MNGGWGYCKFSDTHYSNQAVCYLHPCWFPDPDISDAAHIWISDYRLGDDPFMGRALTPAEFKDASELARAYERQLSGQSKWRFIHHDELIRALDGTHHGALYRLWRPT